MDLINEMIKQTTYTRKALWATIGSLGAAIVILIITIGVGLKQIFQSKEQIRLTKEQINLSNRESKKQIEKLEALESKLGGVIEQLKTSKAEKER